jgi:hypothetical protein
MLRTRHHQPLDNESRLWKASPTPMSVTTAIGSGETTPLRGRRLLPTNVEAMPGRDAPRVTLAFCRPLLSPPSVAPAVVAVATCRRSSPRHAATYDFCRQKRKRRQKDPRHLPPTTQFPSRQLAPPTRAVRRHSQPPPAKRFPASRQTSVVKNALRDRIQSPAIPSLLPRRGRLQ